MPLPPTVSVVLSVRNGANDLPRAIDTILRQTFSDLELIAVNNGSTDGTAEVLDGLCDPRVRVVHQDDMGLAAALNRGIALARGRYIARQDHDDWAKPTRLQKQVAYLDANQDCAMIGTRAEIWVGDDKTERAHDHPCDNAALQFELLFDNPFVHSSMMLRKSALDVVGGYSNDPGRQPPEDYELWSRISRRFKVANLPERLTIYREVPRSMSRAGQNPFIEKVLLISAENLAHAAGDGHPAQPHRDIAAFTHRAFHAVSANHDIEQLCSIVVKAGNRIAEFEGGFAILDQVEARIGNLRRNHAEAKAEHSPRPSPQVFPTEYVAVLGWLKQQIIRLKR